MKRHSRHSTATIRRASVKTHGPARKKAAVGSVKAGETFPSQSAGDLRNAVFGLGFMGEGDIEALCFQVLMQATNDQDNDLRRILAETKAINNAKAALRETLATTSRELASTTSRNVRKALDSLSEMSEMTSLRLQMAMDRRSKFVVSLSNILKKIADSDNAIVQNLK